MAQHGEPWSADRLREQCASKVFSALQEIRDDLRFHDISTLMLGDSTVDVSCLMVLNRWWNRLIEDGETRLANRHVSASYGDVRTVVMSLCRGMGSKRSMMLARPWRLIAAPALPVAPATCPQLTNTAFPTTPCAAWRWA